MLHLFYISLIQWLALFLFSPVCTSHYTHYYVCNLLWTIWCIQVFLTPFQNKEMNQISIPLRLQLGKVATAMVLIAGSRHWFGISLKQFFHLDFGTVNILFNHFDQLCMHECDPVCVRANNKLSNSLHLPLDSAMPEKINQGDYIRAKLNHSWNLADTKRMQMQSSRTRLANNKRKCLNYVSPHKNIQHKNKLGIKVFSPE